MASEGSTDTEDKMSNVRDKRQEMLKELQNQVDEVDRTMESLAELFDTLYRKLTDNSEEMQRNIKDLQDQEEQNEDNTILTDTAKKMSDLIQFAKDVQNKKVETMKSLSKLIHFIHADREEICTDKYLDKCKSLAIDKYLTDQKFPEENGDTLVEMLQEQNKRLQLKYKLSREHVQIVSEREKLLKKECMRLREQSAMASSDSFTCDDEYYYNEQCNPKFHKVDKFAMKKHAPNPIKHSIDREVQTENSEEKSCEPLEEQMDLKSMAENVPVDCSRQSSKEQTENSDEKSHEQLEKQIKELQSIKEKAESSLAEKERLLQSVVLRKVYEVTMVHQNVYKEHKLELQLISKMNAEMERRECVLNNTRAVYAFGGLKAITIVTCLLEPENRSWASVLKNAVALVSDPSNTILVVFYGNKEQSKLEAAVERMCDTLDKFRSVMQLFCSNDVILAQRDIEDIIRIIINNENGRLEVVSCKNCKKQ